jgi:hypothetical protein
MLSKALSKVEPKAVRYCEMCDRWVSAKQTECKACGAMPGHAQPARVTVEADDGRDATVTE